MLKNNPTDRESTPWSPFSIRLPDGLAKLYGGEARRHHSAHQDKLGSRHVYPRDHLAASRPGRPGSQNENNAAAGETPRGGPVPQEEAEGGQEAVSVLPDRGGQEVPPAGGRPDSGDDDHPRRKEEAGDVQARDGRREDGRDTVRGAQDRPVVRVCGTQGHSRDRGGALVAGAVQAAGDKEAQEGP